MPQLLGGGQRDLRLIRARRPDWSLECANCLEHEQNIGAQRIHLHITGGMKNKCRPVGNWGGALSLTQEKYDTITIFLLIT